jgi:cytochrome c oxidase subunit 2
MRRTAKGAAALGIAGLSAFALPSVASAGWLLPESGGSANADSIAELYLVVLVIAGVIFFAVTGTLVYFLVRYRKRRGAVAAQVHGNTQLEIAWTAGAAQRAVGPRRRSAASGARPRPRTRPPARREPSRPSLRDGHR